MSMKILAIDEDRLLHWASNKVLRRLEYSNTEDIITIKIDPDDNLLSPKEQRLAFFLLKNEGGIQFLIRELNEISLTSEIPTFTKAQVVANPVVVEGISNRTVVIEEGVLPKTVVVINRGNITYGAVNYTPRERKGTMTKEILNTIFDKKTKDKNGKFAFSINLAYFNTSNDQQAKACLLHIRRTLNNLKIPLDISIRGKKALFKEV